MRRMTRGTRLVRTALALCLTFSVGLATAAPPKPAVAKKPKTVAERLSGEARKHFESAVLLYEDSNWEGALTEFKTAYEQSKEPRVLRNVAVCEKNLKRYADAIVTLQRSLAEGSDFEPDLVTKIKDEIDILMPLTAVVTFEVDEPGAEVSVDGRVLGTSPLSGTFRVNVGERTFSAKKAQFLDATAKVSVAGGSNVPVKLHLEPAVKTGVAKITANVAAKVSVDGVEAGVTPLTMSVASGKHTFEISAQGYVTQKITREVEFKGTLPLAVTLEKEKHEGFLAIETGVAGAQIKVDDKLVGTGTFRGTVASGGHRVAVLADGYKPYDGDVTVLDGQTRTVSLTLEKNSKTWLWLTGAGVIVAGAGIGAYFLFKPKDESPIAGTINPGVVTVPLSR